MATISDEVKTWFLGDVTGLERAVSRGAGLLDKQIKKERELQKAQTARANSIKSAVLDPGGAARAGIDKLVSSMKLSAVTSGLVGAGIGFAAGKLSEWTAEAAEARKETARFQEEFRQLSQGAKLANRSQGSSSLIEELQKTKEMEKTIKARRDELNPPDGAAGLAQSAKLHAQYFTNYSYGQDYGQLGEDHLKLDRDENKQQATDNDKTQAKLQKEITGAYSDQVSLARERLQGSEREAAAMEMRKQRTAEIIALEGTLANRQENKDAINARYDLQIAKEDELTATTQKRFMLDSRLAGIEISSRTDGEKRLEIARKELGFTVDQIKTRQYVNEEERQGLLIAQARQENAVKAAQAELKVEQSQYALAQRTAALQARNTSTTVKQYQTLLDTNDALKDQLAAIEDINGTKARGLGLDLAGNENAIRLARQDALYGKSNGAIQREMRKNQVDKVKRDQFDTRMDRDDGLINVHRRMDGSIIDGLDPLTGERREPREGKGVVEQGLTTGALTTGRLDSGETGHLFPETSAGNELARSTGARDILKKLRGDLDHDPAARLRHASIFRNLQDAGYGKMMQFPSARRGESPGQMAVKVATLQLGAQHKTNTLIQNLTTAVGKLALTA